MSIVLSKETTTNESSRKRQLKDMINSCGKVVKYLTFTSKNNWMPMMFLPILMHFRPCLSAKISYRGSPFRNISLSTIPGTVWIPLYSAIFCPFFAKNSLSKNSFYVFSTNPRLVTILQYVVRFPEAQNSYYPGTLVQTYFAI